MRILGIFVFGILSEYRHNFNSSVPRSVRKQSNQFLLFHFSKLMKMCNLTICLNKFPPFLRHHYLSLWKGAKSCSIEVRRSMIEWLKKICRNINPNNDNKNISIIRTKQIEFPFKEINLIVQVYILLDIYICMYNK